LNLISLGLRFLDFLLGEFNEFFEDQLQHVSAFAYNSDFFLAAYLYCSHVRVLSDILVLVETILRRFSFSQVDG
jgi:hypothetical protein